jgi:tripartite-type tricarboxylate transporter receptor subunit TctC
MTRLKARPPAVLALILLAASSPVQAQTAGYPDKPIRLIVPFPAGSETDQISRVVTQKMSAGLGQQIVVENRPGASGSLGSEQVAKAAPDGYTIGLITGSTHGVAAALGPLPYDPVKDFAPISMLGVSPYLLVACPCLKITTVDDLVREAKANPGKLSYGSAGPASMAYLAAALFASKAAIDLTHVPYRSSAQSVVDLMTGRIDIQFATIGPTLENIRAGKLWALAITSSRRSPVLPDVPTMIESGFKGYDIVLWLALVAPAATPAPIVDRLNKEVAAVIADPQTQQIFSQQGFEPGASNPAAVIARMQAETASWKALIDKGIVQIQ